MITLTTTQDLTEAQAELLRQYPGVTVTLPRTVECADDRAEEIADRKLEILNIGIL